MRSASHGELVSVISIWVRPHALVAVRLRLCPPYRRQWHKFARETVTAPGKLLWQFTAAWGGLSCNASTLHLARVVSLYDSQPLYGEAA